MKLVRLLLEGGTEVDYQGYDGKTALMIACSFIQQDDGDPNVAFLVKTLLDHDADPNVQDFNGKTALMYAFCYNSPPDVIKFLISKGADLDICDENGMNAWEYLTDKAYTRYSTCLKSRKRPASDPQHTTTKELGIPVVVIDYASPKHIAYDREEIYFKFPSTVDHRRNSVDLKQQLFIRQHSDGVRKAQLIDNDSHRRLTLQNKTRSTSDIRTPKSLSSYGHISERLFVSEVDRRVFAKKRIGSLPKLPPIASRLK